MDLPEPAILAQIIDAASQLAEQALGHPADRHQVAEAVIEWLRALPEGQPIRLPPIRLLGE